MRRVIPAVISVALLLLCLPQIVVAADDDTSKDQTSLRLSDIGDISIINDSKQHIKEAEALLKELADKKEARDRSQEFNKIRPIRARLSKRSPELRALLESFRQYRFSLRNQIEQKKLQLQTKSGAVPQDDLADIEIERSKQEIERLNNDIERNKERLKSATEDEKRDINSNISRAQLEIRSRNVQISYFENRKKSLKDAASASEGEISQIETTLGEVDKVLTDCQSVLRKLDETLVNMDEASNSLLQTDILNINYTDRSTYIFAILVGMVIVGFFSIAFYSQDVRKAIFAGDSGIQFVTLFSLVIAIILFGVLKILEGKELAALLGGLSGYILGRGTQGAIAAAHANPPPPAPNPPPTH